MRFGLFLLWLLSRLPWPLVRAIGKAIGLFFYLVSPHRRRIARINLRLCFPELSEKQRRQLLREHFKATGRSLTERGILWWATADEVRTLVQVEGQEHLDAVKGQPVILLSPHFVGLDMGGLRLTLDMRVASVYGPQRNKHMDDFIRHSRNRFGNTQMISRKDGPRPILTALKEGWAMYYLPDQDFGRRNAVFVPFFGIQAATLTALPRIAKMGKAVVVPCITYQSKNGYVAHLYPAWENFPSEDVEADTRRMNAFIEERVREAPAQYYWLHRRFKTRPEGEARFY